MGSITDPDLRSALRVPAWLLAVVAASGALALGGEERPLRFAVYGGVEGNSAVHRALLKHLAKAPPDFVLLTGGMVAHADRTADWAELDKAIGALGDGCPTYGCAALREGGRAFVRRFGPPDVSSGTNNTYSFERRGLHVVVLDTLVPITRTGAQTTWLAKDLAAAEGKPIVALMHNPIFTIRGRGSRTVARTYWHPLFVKHKVALVLAGNQHFYFRSRQEGVTYVVTAGGGAMLQRIDSRRSLLPDDVVASYFHFIELTLTARDLRGRIVDREGVTRDEFAIPLPRPAR